MANADLLGRESIAITGLEGSGKSHYIMSQVKKILEGGFEYSIYLANVKGVTLEHPNLKIVDADFDWLTAEPNSIVIYDEAGTIDRFSNLHNKLYCEQLKMISQRRKTGVLLVFVAQDSKMLNPAMRVLLKYHFHFSNPYNDDKKTHCFVFPTVKILSNDNKAWHNDATEQFDHELDPAIFPLYKSIDEQNGAKHNKKKQVNKKARLLFIVAGGAVVLCIILMVFGLKMAKAYKDKNLNADAVNTKVNGGVVSAVSSAAQTVVPASAVGGIAPNALQTEQAMNERARRTVELYQERLPKDYEILVNNNDLRVANVVLLNGHCTAYNAYAERLNVPQAYCLQQLHGGMIKPHAAVMQGITQSPYDVPATTTVSAVMPTSASASAFTGQTSTSDKEPVFNPNPNNDYSFNPNKK